MTALLPPAPPRPADWPRIPREKMPLHFGRRIMCDPFGCWIWLGYRTKPGYGQARLPGNRTPMPAHRAVYKMLVGEIPDDLPLDHLCRVKTCVNPDHLDPVTPKENVRRGLNGVLLEFCRLGHPYTPENTGRIKSGNRIGKRYCLTCQTTRWSRAAREGRIA